MKDKIVCVVNELNGKKIARVKIPSYLIAIPDGKESDLDIKGLVLRLLAVEADKMEIEHVVQD